MSGPSRAVPADEGVDARPSSEEVAPGVRLVRLGDHVPLGPLSGYLLSGATTAVIEPGPPESAARALEALAAAGIPRSEVRWLLATHVHLDHAGATGRLLAELPNARVGVHPRGVAHLVDPSRLAEAAQAAWGVRFDRSTAPLPVPADRVVALHDGQGIDLGAGRVVKVIYTPGHATHHCCFVDHATRGVFTGDATGAHYDGSCSPFGVPLTTPGAAPPRLDVEAFLQSLVRIAAEEPRLLYHTHFGVQPYSVEVLEHAAGQVTLLQALARSIHARGGTPDDMVETYLGWLASSRPGLRMELLRVHTRFNNHSIWRSTIRDA